MSGQPRVGTALVLSSLAHAALLGGVLLAGRPRPADRPLAVRLVQLATGQAVSASPLGEAGPPSQARAPARPAPRGPRGHTPEAVAMEPPAPLQAPGASALQEADAAPGAAVPGGTAVWAAAASGPAGAGETLGGGVGTVSLLGELHRRLAEAARRCYPAAARRFRLQGQVPVHFCLDAHGVASALSLEGTTGSPLLDRSALECVVPGASPLPGLEGCFLVPVHFGS
ncbi:MAG: energy transducer TonB [Myxococcaceae bacterium]